MPASLGKDARQYWTIKYTLALIDICVVSGLLFLSMGTGASKSLESSVRWLCAIPSLTLPLYLGAGMCIYWLADMPLHFYQSYALEHRFSLSRQTLGDWFKDQGKGFLLSYILFLICAEVFYSLLRISPGHWWILMSLFWIFFSLILAKLTPVLIIPLFFKYKELSDEGLRQRIKTLARKMGIAILDVFEIDFSRKTIKANAALVGWGKTRRVILADTLRNNFTQDEIEVVLAHEFAHFRLRHLLKLVFLSAAFTIASFYLVFATSSRFLQSAGLSSLSELAALPLVILYFFFINLMITPFQNGISRAFERSADLLALRTTGRKDAFICAMEKLASQNLADTSPHPVIKFLFFDHPPIEERIALARDK